MFHPSIPDIHTYSSVCSVGKSHDTRQKDNPNAKPVNPAKKQTKKMLFLGAARDTGSAVRALLRVDLPTVG